MIVGQIHSDAISSIPFVLLHDEMACLPYQHADSTVGGSCPNDGARVLTGIPPDDAAVVKRHWPR